MSHRTTTLIDVTFESILDVIRAEYTDLPGQCLTKPQVQRMWGLEPEFRDMLLRELIEEGFLREIEGNYVRATVHP